MDDKVTHTYIGPTAFQNVVKQYDVDWNIPGRIDNRLTTKLGNRLSKIDAPDWLLNVNGEIVSTGWDNFYLNEDFIPMVESVCRENAATGLIVVRSYGASRWVLNSDRYLDGYGIYSRSSFGQNTAFVYTNFGAQVFNCDPPAYTIWSGAPQLPLIDDYFEPEDKEHLPESELDKARPLIEHAADELVDQLFEKIEGQTR